VLSKAKGIVWLEQQTGEAIEVAPAAVGADRHLSVRVPVEVAAQPHRVTTAIDGRRNGRSRHATPRGRRPGGRGPTSMIGQ